MEDGKCMERFNKDTSNNLTDEENALVAALMHYPLLEEVFDQNNAQNLAVIRQKMLSTITELERVVRRGSQVEAEKSSRIILAFRTTLDFLDELDHRRRAN